MLKIFSLLSEIGKLVLCMVYINTEVCFVVIFIPFLVKNTQVIITIYLLEIMYKTFR